MKRQTLLKSTLCLLMALLCNVAWAQTTFTFTRGENKAATVTAPEGLTATMATNVDWLTSGAMGSNTGVLCPNKNTNATTAESPITFTLTVSGLTPGQEFTAANFTHKAVSGTGGFQGNGDKIRHCNLTLTAGGEPVATLTNQNIWVPEGSANHDKVITFDNAFTADAEGNLTLTLTIVKGESNDGCFYGLTKIELYKAGPIVTFTNVQQDGTEFALYIDENNQLAISKEPASELGAAAQFRATMNPNGKYTFYNESKKRYMIWKGSSGGYNNNSGVLAEYNATYCDWQMTQANETAKGTFYFNGKRSNGTSDGTLVIKKATPSFDLYGNSKAWDATYTNLYRIEAVAPIEYTLTDSKSGLQFTGTGASLEPMGDGVTLANKKLDGTKFTADATFPFPVSKEGGVTNATMIANGASWGNPNSRKWRAVTDNSVDYVKVQTTETNLVDASQWLWAIYPELNNGAFSFKIKNIATGKYVYANPEATGGTNDVKGTNKPVTLSDTGTAFSYKNRTGSNYYHFEYTNTASTTLRPSMNGAGDTDVFLGVYSGSHSGNDVCFPNPMEHTVFPFPVSTAEETKATLLANWGNANNTSTKKWHAVLEDGVYNLKVQTETPKITELNTWKWAIYPQLDNGVFTFKIKNIHTGTYVYANPENTANALGSKGYITLQEEGTAFTIVKNGNFINLAYVGKNSKILKLTTNGSGDTDVYLGSYEGTHNGNHINWPAFTSYSTTIGASGYSAIYTPIAVTIPDGVKVYAGKVDGNWVVPSEVSGTVIPANTAVILKGTAAGTYTFNKTDDDAEAIADNDLKGSSERVTLTEEQGYTMPADAAAFKMQVGDIAPYTAYITRPIGSAKELGIFIEGYILGSHEGFVNEGVYTFVTARGWMGAKNDNNNVISTAKASHGLTGSDEEPMFQWSVYKSKNGYYYLYNIGKQQFMGVQSSNNTSIPFAATPNNRKFTFKKSSSSTHPIMFSTDNAGVANHSADFGDGLITWTGGWNNLNDGGSNHQVTLVDKLTEANLTTIAEAVEAYEAELKSQAIEALGTAITTAQPKRNGMGKGLGYYSSTDVNATTTFDAIVEFKNSITDETTINAIEGHTKTVNELFTLNVPQPGKFYRIKNNAGNGYLSSGESGRTQFKAGIENDANSIFLYIDGKLLSYKNGMYIHNNGGQLKYADNIGEGIAINFVSSLEPGKLQIHYYTTENRYLYSGGTGNTDAGRDAANTTEARYRFTVEEVTSLPVTISAAGYTTLYAPVALEIDADVEAYVVSEVQSSSVLLEQVTGIVPAETGLIIKGDQGEYSFSIGGEATAEITTNELKGTVAKSLITPEDGTTCYVLANPQGGNGVGLYKASLNKNEGTAFINNGCKVYLPVETPAEQAAPALVMRFGRGQGTTEIENVETMDNGQQTTVIFDITGRRIEKIVEKGMYIINGKKVVIR